MHVYCLFILSSCTSTFRYNAYPPPALCQYSLYRLQYIQTAMMFPDSQRSWGQLHINSAINWNSSKGFFSLFACFVWRLKCSRCSSPPPPRVSKCLLLFVGSAWKSFSTALRWISITKNAFISSDIEVYTRIAFHNCVQVTESGEEFCYERLVLFSDTTNAIRAAPMCLNYAHNFFEE